MRIGSVSVTVVDDWKQEEHGTFGIGDARSYEIRLNVPEELRATTLLHEVLHAISELYGLDLPEGTVRVLEQTLVSFVLDNPETARAFTNGLTLSKPTEF